MSPICPHITEEIWSILGNKKSIHLQKNPTFDDKLLEKDNLTLMVQINGKLRDQIQVEKNAPKEQIIDNAKKIKKNSTTSRRYENHKKYLRARKNN